MLAVVVQHVLYNNNIFGMDAFRWHIPGFLVISGYFGVRFNAGKFIRLVLIAYLCYWLTIPLQGGNYTLLSLALPHGGWFLPFYCVLMVISPVFNAALESPKNWKSIAVSVALLVLIGWIPTFSSNPHLGMIRVQGMQGNGLMMMLVLYVVGFMLHALSIENRFTWWFWVLMFVVGIGCCYGMGLVCPSACHYASPISILTAACGFCMFMTMPRIGGIFAKAINFIAPSMFSIYLIHECCVKKYQYLPAGSGVMDAILRAVILFVACIGVDMVRRYIMFVGDKIIDRYWSKR